MYCNQKVLEERSGARHDARLYIPVEACEIQNRQESYGIGSAREFITETHDRQDELRIPGIALQLLS